MLGPPPPVACSRYQCWSDRRAPSRRPIAPKIYVPFPAQDLSPREESASKFPRGGRLAVRTSPRLIAPRKSLLELADLQHLAGGALPQRNHGRFGRSVAHQLNGA